MQTLSSISGLSLLSLQISPGSRPLGTIPSQSPASLHLTKPWHRPLKQRMVLMKNAGDVARSFYAYVQSAATRAIFRKYGFVLPGEAV